MFVGAMQACERYSCLPVRGLGRHVRSGCHRVPRCSTPPGKHNWPGARCGQSKHRHSRAAERRRSAAVVDALVAFNDKIADPSGYSRYAVLIQTPIAARPSAGSGQDDLRLAVRRIAGGAGPVSRPGHRIANSHPRRRYCTQPRLHRCLARHLRIPGARLHQQARLRDFRRP